MSSKYGLFKRCAAAVILVFILILGIWWSGATRSAFAEETEYSSALADLQKDETFDRNLYPDNLNDYSIQLITVAESADKELFVYVYQPCQSAYPLTATHINMSLSDKVGGIVVDGETVAGSDTSKLYELTLLNSSGVFVKYKVEGLTVSGDIVRYYTISAIYRDYIEGIDPGTGNDNTKTSRAFAVGKQFAAVTTESGVVYSCKDIDFMVIKDPFVDFLAYGTYDGFDLIFGNVDYTDIHYIAFTPDRQIDTLKEADITYTTQDYTLNADGPDTGYTYGKKSEPQFKTLTGEEKVGVDGYAEYTWKSIYTSRDFMATTTLTGDAKTQVENSEFVLVFLATKCKEQSLTDLMQGHYKRVTGTKVSDVSILRLMFETDGVTYNLGVVMDRQEGDDIAGNKPEYNDGSCVDGFMTAIMIIALLILFIILWPVLPYIAKAIVWVVSLPFKGIAAIVKVVKKKKPKDTGQTVSDTVKPPQPKAIKVTQNKPSVEKPKGKNKR